MGIKSRVINVARTLYRDYRAKQSETRAGFKPISQREAFTMEGLLSAEEKKHYCERKAYAQLRYFPNLDNPTTYSEKLIWLAIHYKNPLIARCADKYELKGYIEEKFGENRCVPALGVFDNVNDIDFDALPNSFVLKSTAGWGSKHVLIVEDKSKMNLDKVKAIIASWLYPWNTYYYNNLCITDEKIVPRILIEEYLRPEHYAGSNESDKGAFLQDFKIFCFDGVPRYALVVKGRDTEGFSKTFIDLDGWAVLPIWRKKAKTEEHPEKPKELDEMVEMSRILSKGFPVVRVDFFLHGGKVYVGEMTFSPGLFLSVNPREWDYELGKAIDIEKVR